jgi:hypothetical protein
MSQNKGYIKYNIIKDITIKKCFELLNLIGALYIKVNLEFIISLLFNSGFLCDEHLFID